MWFIFALLSGVSNAGANVSRRMKGQTAQPVILSWWTSLLSIPVAGLFVLLDPAPLYTNTDFLLPATISAFIGMITHILVFKAYKLSEASVISPLSNLLPALLIVSSFIMFGTVPTLGGLIGILLVVGGMYYSSVSSKHQLFHPLRSLLREKGARFMLIVVLLWAVTANLEQISVRSASPTFVVFYAVCVGFILTSLYAKFHLRGSQKRYHVFRRWKWHILAITVFTTVSVVLQMHAIALADTSYVLAVKRTDVLFTVLAGGLLLKERHMYKRLTGAGIGLIGILIIVLAQ